MVEILFNVLASWQVILVLLLLILITPLIISRVYQTKKSKQKRDLSWNSIFKKQKKMGSDSSKERLTKESQRNENDQDNSSPGKLYVSDSTYEMLKREKRIHNVDE